VKLVDLVRFLCIGCHVVRGVFFKKRVIEMKALNSWVAAVVTCSAIASQANADVLMAGSFDAASNSNSNLNSPDAVGHENRNSSRPVFVPGSLINKTSTGAWLMAESVRRDAVARPRKVEMNLLAGRITPIPPAGTELRAISTFAQFAQMFKPTNNGEVQAMVGDEDEVEPRTSNMTLIGLFTFSLAGITAVISASRRGFFYAIGVTRLSSFR
jgi:hypothetical protein